MSEHFAYEPVSEEQTYRDHGLGDVWDAAEAGDAMAVLLRERMRSAEKAFRARAQPLIDAMWEAGTSESLGRLVR